MPINEQQPEQPAPSPSNLGLKWPGDRREPTGAGQSPDAAGADRSRAEQSESILKRHNLPEGYLEVGGGGWTPDRPPSLMDLLVHELIPQPSEEALDLVRWDPVVYQLTVRDRFVAPYKLLMASAITLLQQAEDGVGASSTGFMVDELTAACYRGSMVLMAEDWRRSGCPNAEGIPIIRRPNEAPRFA